MTSADSLMLWIAGFHFVGLLCVAALLIPALRSDDTPGSAEGGSSDDGWGNLPQEPPRPKLLPGGGIPLPDAVPSRVRLRDHRRLSDMRKAPERRPAREPVRTPQRVPGAH
ncbi:MAG: hypothetical protein ACLP0J_26540 [Solirubrobacteraceae bacterium]